MPMVSYSDGPLDVIFGYTRHSTGGSTHAAIVLATTATTELQLTGRRGSGVSLPIAVAGDFTKAESAGAEKDHFNMASIGAGTGAIIRAGLGAVDATVALLTTFQWAFDAYGSRNGSSSAVIGSATVFWRTAPVFKGLTFGYRFRYQSWSVSDPLLNYTSVFHGPYIGAMF